MPRLLEAELDALLASVPAIAIEGAKGVGKTATARRRAASVWELDDPGQRLLGEASPGRLLGSETPVLLDEWQRLPPIWDAVRRAVDEAAPPGSFLLTGSASPHAATHSGAGRIVTVHMRPLTLAERQLGTPTVSLARLLDGAREPLEGATGVQLEHYVTEIVRSGFPGLRGLPARAVHARLDAYVDRIVEHDLAELGRPVRRPSIVRRWLGACAAATASTASLEKLRDAATSNQGDKPARSTVLPYTDLLRRLWVLDPVQAWLPSANQLARMSTPDKHHLVDPALAARLLQVDAEVLLGPGTPAAPLGGDRTLLGALFESLVTQSVRVYAQAAEATTAHLRTHGGQHEVDLVVLRRDMVLAIEVKLAPAVRDDDVRNLRWLRDQIGPRLADAVVVTTGPEAYRRKDGIAVVPAALLGP